MRSREETSSNEGTAQQKGKSNYSNKERTSAAHPSIYRSPRLRKEDLVELWEDLRKRLLSLLSAERNIWEKNRKGSQFIKDPSTLQRRYWVT